MAPLLVGSRGEARPEVTLSLISRPSANEPIDHAAARAATNKPRAPQRCIVPPKQAVGPRARRMSNGATPPTLRVLARQPSSCASAKLPGTPHSARSTSIISGASSDISDISSFDGSINGEKRRSVRRAMPRLRLPASASQLRLSVPSWRKPGRGAAADADAEEAGGGTQPTVSTTQPTVSEGDESPTAGGRSDAEALRGEVILADEPEASAAGETTLGDAKAAKREQKREQKCEQKCEQAWLPFSDPELQTLAAVRRWLGAARFDAVPLDLLVCFLRGYAYRKDWAETVYVELSEALEWRGRAAADSVLDSPPADRPLFEQLYQSGPVGRDQQGHIVELMRLGRLKVSKLFKSFELDAIIKQVTYAAEAKRACNIANCGALGKRTYKTVVVIDCQGLDSDQPDRGRLNSDHLGKEFRVLMKKTAEVLSGHYPETMHKTYIINGPLIVRAAWNVTRHMMHPLSAAKIAILGSDWKKVFDRDGIVLDGNSLPASIGWSEAVGELPADGGAARRRGWAPPADLAALAALAEGAQG
ncbi:hypothetical protein EMIHUDRAFT_453979 [Emiliania huxleyi CCMP1516]|uniref:CRAL-TRIO domain-containing protein n=2 Tax=Emiliania huxleyi TaxID=2903 RepID=A0A0D3HYL2_EMIH1|nr:hypothetical protein EMIHUDRAFT_453979 [Emiliania huxleyi CCMP1516]EOD04097.1 hypothetical protein EMIHUDRAFT_453979 [Emiliania huxleyi CCMP1516]|eukprot:XP_005756526.1 hypothetical protein EMIHUDRAFT_453979 [Emiliania huxleyi CCMP1516]